jgi:predicted GNAT family N-acyltransferase
VADPRIIELAAADPGFAECFRIRVAVFVDEQRVPLAEERDEHDAAARHFLAYHGAAAVGTARVLRPAPGVAKITRVAVLREARGLGVGAALMRHVEAHVPAAAYRLDAQTHALRFYESLGYRAEGAEFLEAGLPHFHMLKRNF